MSELKEKLGEVKRSSREVKIAFGKLLCVVGLILFAPIYFIYLLCKGK